MPGKARILIAEDDPLSASVLRQLLEEDYRTVLAENGREAWDASQKQNFDLMLVDLMMPEIDGLDLCQRLRAQERTSQVPIIIVTARGQTEDMLAGFNAGANDYITKPIDPPVLRARVATHLRIAKLQRERNEFASMLTHDLKAPLTLILGAAAHLREQIETGKAAPGNSAHFLDSIRANVKRMTGMINNSLTLSKLEDEQFPLRRELFDPSHLAHSLFEDALSLAKRKNIKLVSQSVNLPNELDADRDTLTRALENLVFNAIKFTPDSGEVSLRFETGGGRMSFTVEDTGPGIPEKVLPRIFSRYERGKFGESEGAGLGLAIAKLAAEAHGGDVEAENRASGGARFVFWIPVHTGN